MTDESQWSDEELIAHAREMAAVYADVCSPQVGWLVGLIDRRDAEIERLRADVKAYQRLVDLIFQRRAVTKYRPVDAEGVNDER